MMATYGFVYVMFSPCMPGLYKIGMTLRSPQQRAQELSASTGVPEPYEVVYYIETENPQEFEQEMHHFLSRYRINSSREFFRAPLREIIDTMRLWDSGYEIEALTNIANEALDPGSVDPWDPLWFEKNLYEPGYLRSLKRDVPGLEVVS